MSKLKGGNSNWRGPIWFPTNYLLVDSLRRLGKAFGDQLQFEAPSISDQPVAASELAGDLAKRLMRVFEVDESGKRAWCGNRERFHEDPHWKDLHLFYEYFHGDKGTGLGLSLIHI